MAIFTGTSLKPSFYDSKQKHDSKQPQNHTKEKGEGRRKERGEEKRLLTLTIFAIPTKKKTLAAHWFRRLNRGGPFSKIQLDI